MVDPRLAMPAEWEGEWLGQFLACLIALNMQSTNLTQDCPVASDIKACSSKPGVDDQLETNSAEPTVPSTDVPVVPQPHPSQATSFTPTKGQSALGLVSGAHSWLRPPPVDRP